MFDNLSPKPFIYLSHVYPLFLENFVGTYDILSKNNAYAISILVKNVSGSAGKLYLNNQTDGLALGAGAVVALSNVWIRMFKVTVASDVVLAITKEVVR